MMSFKAEKYFTYWPKVLDLELSIQTHRLQQMLHRSHREAIEKSMSDLLNSFLVKGSSKILKQYKLLDSF